MKYIQENCLCRLQEYWKAQIFIDILKQKLKVSRKAMLIQESAAQGPAMLLRMTFVNSLWHDYFENVLLSQLKLESCT